MLISKYTYLIHKTERVPKVYFNVKIANYIITYNINIQPKYQMSVSI